MFALIGHPSWRKRLARRGYNPALNLSRLVDGVARIRATPRKTEKVAIIAELLAEARGEEASLVALYLSGTLPQGRIGLGWKAIQAAMGDPRVAGEPLGLSD